MGGRGAIVLSEDREGANRPERSHVRQSTHVCRRRLAMPVELTRDAEARERVGIEALVRLVTVDHVGVAIKDFRKPSRAGARHTDEQDRSLTNGAPALGIAVTERGAGDIGSSIHAQACATGQEDLLLEDGAETQLSTEPGNASPRLRRCHVLDDAQRRRQLRSTRRGAEATAGSLDTRMLTAPRVHPITIIYVYHNKFQFLRPHAHARGARCASRNLLIWTPDCSKRGKCDGSHTLDERLSLRSGCKFMVTSW